MSLPKILIYGQPFNNYTGGGITLSNLFKGWPDDKIAVTYLGHGLMNVTTDVCHTYYQLGVEEHKWIFPFNLIQRKFNSGLKSFSAVQKSQINSIQKGLRFRLVNRFFYPFLRWIGLFHVVSKIRISEGLKDWLKIYEPDILYIQVSTREDILFSIGLIDMLKIPSVLHVMDDWPSTISDRGLFKRYWKRKIDREFKILLEKFDFFMSISDAMSEEYGKRYGKKFVAFHNPIDTEIWESVQKKDFNINADYITLLYSGRIGDKGIAGSLVEIAEAVDSLNEENLNIRFHIQTATKTDWILELLKRYKCVVFNDYAEYSQIPSIFSSADILVLANDFSSDGIRYLKLSMPTKASEYMISGSPVIVYASPETAVSRFFSDNNCGYCIVRQGPDEIKKGLKFLLDNYDYRKRISKNAIQLARERFDARVVRADFQSILKNLKIKHNVY